MTYYAGSHTRGGRTEPERRYARKSTLTLAEQIASKQTSILFAETELRKAQESGNSLHIEAAEMILRAMRAGLATLEAKQKEQEAGR